MLETVRIVEGQNLGSHSASHQIIHTLFIAQRVCKDFSLVACHRKNVARLAPKLYSYVLCKSVCHKKSLSDACLWTGLHAESNHLTSQPPMGPTSVAVIIGVFQVHF